MCSPPKSSHTQGLHQEPPFSLALPWLPLLCGPITAAILGVGLTCKVELSCMKAGLPLSPRAPQGLA